MNIKNLLQMLESNNGRITNVKIKSTYETLDSESANAGMICDIIGCWYDANYESWVIKMNFEPYIEYNKSIASHDWYDKTGEPVLTWFETNHYKKDGHKTCVEEDQNLDDYFDFQEGKQYVFSTNFCSKVMVNAINSNIAKIQFVDKLIEFGYIEIKS